MPIVYRKAIHEAIERSDGKDAYTGEPVDFLLLQLFAGAPVSGRDESIVPTLDHVVLSPTAPQFEICSLRTNKCKANLTEIELLEFAKKIVAFHKIKWGTK